MNNKPLRAILPLLKAPVTERGDAYFKLAIGGSTTITIQANLGYVDLKVGDILTLYTEVLLAKPQ